LLRSLIFINIHTLWQHWKPW